MTFATSTGGESADRAGGYRHQATKDSLRLVLSAVNGRARTYAKVRLGRLIDHLIEAGVATIPQPFRRKSNPLDRLLEI